MNHDDRARKLLSGPRGRRLCAELLVPLDGRDPFWWPVLAGRQVASDDVQAAVARTDLESVAPPWRLDEALQASVDRAMYWQEPDQVDAVLADDDVAAHLLPVAETVVAAEASQWWTEPTAREDQHAVVWPSTGPTEPGRPTTIGARAALDAWRDQALADELRAARERPADPRASWSGEWWSTPAMAGLVVTSRSRPEDPRSAAGIRTPLSLPVGLTLVEDEMGWPTARTWPFQAPATAGVYEITGPEAWTTLVEQYPLGVTASKRHDWWRVTGWDGAWVIPDWAAVATRFDAVHLTVDGYLSTAGRALPVDVPGAPVRTLLAGWDPDATWWLAAVLPDPGEHTDWRRREDEPPRWEPAD